VVRFRSDGHAHADFACPLGDADEHDVHDANSSDEQGHERDARQKRRHRFGAFLLRSGNFGEVAD
jgi:hypothetical protein